MFRGSYNARGEFAYALLQRTISLMLAFSLSLGSAGQTTLVSAAEPSQQKAKTITTIFIDIQLPKEPVCTKSEPTVLVRTRADTDIPLRNGKVEHVSDGPISGVRVESAVTNPDIGALSPKTLISGFNVEENPAEANFTFEAKKAGTTILQFTPEYAGKKGQMEEIGIKVVDCKLKVNMNYLMHQSSGGTTGLLTGQMDTVLEGDGEVYQGAGILDSDRTEVMPPCSFSSDGFDSPATITAKLTGSPDNQQLEVTVDYEPGESSTTITCPIAGTRTTTRPEDPTDWLATNATFLGTGGAQSFPIDFAHWFGRLIITLTPVEGASS
jgi:hypothetical protein